jgi:hypothetical protein
LQQRRVPGDRRFTEEDARNSLGMEDQCSPLVLSDSFM